jgi:uncharacterized protein YegP (UPF0339 family)
MEPSNIPHGKERAPYGFHLLFKEDEKYYFQFNDDDGEPLLFSKSYTSEKGCMNGVQAVIRAVESDASFEIKNTKNNKHFFVLKSGNHRTIGRSRTFDTLKELRAKMGLLQQIDENIPVHEMTDEVPLEEEQADTPKSENREAAPDPQKSKESMPRYKFSLIYYPDSEIWSVRNDFSGKSVKLRELDNQKLESFLRSELPPKHQRALPIAPPAKAQTSATTKETKKTGTRKPLQLQLRSATGNIIKKLAGKGEIASIELAPETAQELNTPSLNAVVTARAVGDNQPIVVGVNNHLSTEEGRIKVPVYGTNRLKEGLYVFSAKLNSGDVPAYYGEYMVMLN